MKNRIWLIASLSCSVVLLMSPSSKAGQSAPVTGHTQRTIASGKTTVKESAQHQSKVTLNSKLVPPIAELPTPSATVVKPRKFHPVKHWHRPSRGVFNGMAK